MPNRKSGRLLTPRLSFAVAIAAALTGVLMAVLVAPAFGSHSVGTGATWSSSNAAKTITATMFVPGVNCASVANDSYSGLESGIQVFGEYRGGGANVDAGDFAGIYSYCEGTTAYYAPEFVLADFSQGVYKLKGAGFTVTPSDPITLSITVTHAGVKLTIGDSNTHQSKTVTGPSLGTGKGWAVGASPIFASLSGTPLLSGSTSIVSQYTLTGGPDQVTGPPAFSAAVFRYVTVNGVTLDATAPSSTGNIVAHVSHSLGAHASTWQGTDGTAASVSSVTHGNFTAKPGSIPPPQLGATYDVQKVKGSVQIELPNSHKFVKFTKGERLPNGSQIDASNGQVQITLALGQGKSETGLFYGGRFKFNQKHNGNASATVVDSDAQDCTDPEATTTKTGAIAHGASASAQKKTKKKQLGSLWSNAHGNFTTKGNAGAGAVLGTKWLTENLCDGSTYFYVERDKVKVTAYYPYKHTVVVEAGHSYLAPGPNASGAVQLVGLQEQDGAYDVKLGSSFDLIAVSATQPTYVFAAPAPQKPFGSGQFTSDGSVNGVPRWIAQVNITPNMSHFSYWNIGVEIGSQQYTFKLRLS